MTTRQSYPDVWASGGNAVDPDLDTTDPSFVANKYETKGWISQKPPEQWQNFLTQISDLKIVERLIDGIVEWQAGVPYRIGALVKLQDSVWISGVNNNTNAVVEGVNWKKVLGDLTSSNYNSLVDALALIFTQHLNSANPHNDTVNTLVDGSYIKSDVDGFFGGATNPKTIVYHKLQMGQTAHGETPAQVGVLPTLGGVFTGDVIQTARILLASNKAVNINPATNQLEFNFSGKRIAIDDSGAWFYETSIPTLIMTEANYDDMECRINNSFALPFPVIMMNLETSINDAKSIGSWTLTTTKDPEFVVGKGLKVSDNATTLAGFVYNGACTVLVVGATDVANSVVYKDFNSASYATMAQVLTAVVSPATHVKQIVVYPQLSDYQKTLLVK